MGKVLLWIMGGGAAFVVLLFFIGLASDGPRSSIEDRIEESCRREYRTEEEIVRCRLQLVLEKRPEIERDRTEQTRRY